LTTDILRACPGIKAAEVRVLFSGVRLLFGLNEGTECDA